MQNKNVENINFDIVLKMCRKSHTSGNETDVIKHNIIQSYTSA